MADDPTEFAQFLLRHAKGRAHDELSAKLNEAVEAVKRLGKGGEVALKVSISPIKGNDEVVRVETNVTSKLPKEPVTSMWYADDDGSLHRNDPKQHPLWDDNKADGKSAAAGKDN